MGLRNVPGVALSDWLRLAPHDANVQNLAATHQDYGGLVKADWRNIASLTMSEVSSTRHFGTVTNDSSGETRQSLRLVNSEATPVRLRRIARYCCMRFDLSARFRVSRRNYDQEMHCARDCLNCGGWIVPFSAGYDVRSRCFSSRDQGARRQQQFKDHRRRHPDVAKGHPVSAKATHCS